MATAYDFSNFTADDLLEAELAEEERVARAQARADASAGKLNAFKALMGQSQTARANVISSDSDAAALKAYSTGKDVEHLSHIRQRMAAAMEKGDLWLNDIRQFNTWYKDQNFPYRFEKDIRTAYESMSGERGEEKTEARTSTQFRQTQADRRETKAYEATGEEANVLLNRIKDQYTTHKPGRQQLGKAQAIDQLTSGLIELGIKGKDLSSYTARLESVIKLTEEMRAGTVNKTAGRYATEIIKGLEDETYNYVQAMAKFNEWTAGLDPSSAGVKAARTALTDHISAMKYTQENVAVALADGRLDFVTKKELEQAPDGTFFPPATHRAIPPAMALVAFMVGEEEGVEPLPIEFIRKVIQSGFSAIATLDATEQAHWNAWVKKYKEKNPDLLAAIVAQFAAGGTPPDSAVTINR